MRDTVKNSKNMKIENEHMRIAMFGHKRVPGRESGIEVVVWELAKRMVALGHQVSCYNRKGHHVSGKEFDNYKTQIVDGVIIRELPTIDRRGLAALTSSIAGSIITAFGKYDVVHIHAEGPAFMCWLPKLFGKRVVVTIHGLDWQRAKWGKLASTYIRLGEKNAVRFADEVIVLSAGLQKYFQDTYGRKTRYIPNGVDIHEPVEADEIKNLYGLKKNGYVLYLGRIVPEKGLNYLVEAWKGVETEKKLVIAGGSSDTELFESELKSITRDDSRILFTGFVQGKILEELYSNCYLYVLPSDIEGMPMTLLEAMSYGCCCLTSDIDECVEVIGADGLTFRKGDVEDLRKKLTNCLCNLRMKELEAIRLKDESLGFEWEEIVEQTIGCYWGANTT